MIIALTGMLLHKRKLHDTTHTSHACKCSVTNIGSTITYKSRDTRAGVQSRDTRAGVQSRDTRAGARSRDTGLEKLC